jgi:hypothetical protein
MTKIAAGTAVLATFGLAVLAPAACATFHEMSIREVYPGSTASPGAEYVELQMWAPGQNLVGGHSLRTYGPAGNLTATTTFAGDVSGAANQSTILLATPAVEAAFGVGPDTAMTEGQLDPAGGAVCWESLDCVSWGSFAGSLPSPSGSPAVPGGIPDGMALRRTIAPGCPTLLEPTDDHDNSAADFSAVFPSPRPNSIAPGERPCSAGGAPQGGEEQEGQAGEHGKRLQTRLTRRPPRRSADPTPTIRFTANEEGVTFQCRLDGKAFKPCRSPFTTKPLRPGHHLFEVRARAGSGERDRSPARCAFAVISRRR